MAATILARLPYASTKATRYTLAPKINGFPAYLMTNHFSFQEKDTTLGLADDVGGLRYPITKGAAPEDAASIATKGGLRLVGRASMVGPLVSMIQPFTFILAVNAVTPAAAKSIEIGSLGDFPTRGMVSWLGAANPIPADKLHPANLWQAADGAPGSGALNYIATPLPYVGKFDALQIVAIYHKGNGVIRLEQRQGALITRTADVQWDATKWLGPANAQQGAQVMRVGAFATGFVNSTGMTVECASFYGRDLSILESDVQAWVAGAYALAAKRGRA